jgi:hypothetical protein
LPATVLKNIYYPFVPSHLMYAIEAYANICHTYLDNLVNFNNKMLRILQNKPAQFPVVESYQAYKTLPIPQLHELHLLILAAKTLHNPEKLPNISQDCSVANGVVHTHITRKQEDLHICRVDTMYGQRCLKYKISKLWNDILCDQKQIGD